MKTKLKGLYPSMRSRNERLAVSREAAVPKRERVWRPGVSLERCSLGPFRCCAVSPAGRR